MYDPKIALRAFMDSVTFPNRPDALRFLVRTRELLEFEKEQRAFPVVYLYCNWAVHTQITGSAAGFDLLKKLTTIFVDNSLTKGIGATNGDLIDDINRELSISALRAQLIALFSKYNISSEFTQSKSVWNAFVADVLEEVRAKPIQYPDGPISSWRSNDAKDAYRAAEGVCTAAFVHNPTLIENHFIDRFYFDYVQGQRGDTPGQQHILTWILRLRKNVSMMGELKWDDEPVSAFNNS